METYTTKQTSSIHSGSSKDVKQKNIPFVIVVTAMELSDGTSVILQAKKFLHLPNNIYIILSITQMREYGVEDNEKGKCHNGLQNIFEEGK